MLGVQADAGTHPACLALTEALRTRLLDHEFSLSFVKLVEGEPPAAEEGPLYEGPHLDSHPRLTDSTELLRLLVNLSRHPRRFEFAVTDRWQLAEQGVRYGRREFEPLVLPASIQTRVVELPGRTDTRLYALRFLASAVPHVGLNDPPEHFLVSFEAVTARPCA